MTREGTLIEANGKARGYLEVAGLKPEDALGKPFEEAYWWSYSESIRQQLREAIERAAKGGTSRYDVVVRTGQDSFATTDFCVQPLFDHIGRVTYLVACATDITHRVRLEAEAGEHMKLEKVIGMVLHDGLRCADLSVVCRTCLEMAVEITSSAFGFVGELNDRGKFDTTFMADARREAYPAPKDQAVPRLRDMEVRGLWGEVIKHNNPLITNDPSSHPAGVGTPQGHPPVQCFLGVPLVRSVQAFGVFSVANKPGGYEERDCEFLERLSAAFVLAQDRSRAEKALRDARDELNARLAERSGELAQPDIGLGRPDSLESESLAIMGHESRNLLNHIIGFTGMLLQGIAGETNEAQRKHLSIVYGSAKRLLNLINDILDLWSIESGKMGVSTETFAIRDIAAEVSRSLSPVISQEGLRLITEIPDDTPRIHSDKKKVLRILLNLVGNAVKLTKTGEIRIGCRFDSENLEVSVCFTGMGIRRENIDHVFEAFRQVGGTAQSGYEGSGRKPNMATAPSLRLRYLSDLMKQNSMKTPTWYSRICNSAGWKVMSAAER